MISNYPEPPPFDLPPRGDVTREPPQLGGQAAPEHNDREYLDLRHQGGGRLLHDFVWTSDPKQLQDDLGCH